VAIVFPADVERREKTRLEDSRFARTAAALAEKGISVEGAPYVAGDGEALHKQLARVDGVLVWINPIVDGRNRTDLNKVLADVAVSGVFVSAHPDVIAKMGTKDILFRTRTMGWGCDTRHYPTLAAMQRELPESLATGEARVVKRVRGHSGDGVWKVELADQATSGLPSVVSSHADVRVRHAKRSFLRRARSTARIARRKLRETSLSRHCRAGRLRAARRSLPHDPAPDSSAPCLRKVGAGRSDPARRAWSFLPRPSQVFGG
jgi:hypothetical protein